MSIINSDLLKENIQKYRKTSEAKLNYAVSGLRAKGAVLDCPVFRTGLIAGLRSIERNGAAIGVMITASHNPADDNGVKIVDPRGEMLDRDWVRLATECINLSDDELQAWLNEKIQQLNLNDQLQATVFIAKDTRESSVRLATAASDGVRSVGGQFKDFGFLTTPQLHYIVNCANTDEAYGRATEEGYYLKYSSSFLGLIAKLNATTRYESVLNIDCANGVGAPKMSQMVEHLAGALKISLINTGDGVLNADCGADYVKIEQRAPKNLELKPNEKFASFDGDADRLVYYYLNPETNAFRLLDGDKIAALFAIYINGVLRRMHLSDDLDVSVVQTAYANGSSTKYIEKVLGMRTYCVATGVLNLHHKAAQCDIGIYFEANGHGTILFGDKIISILKGLAQDENAKELLLFVDLINQTAGDAISDLLATEFILRQLDWSAHQWSEIYTDLPQRQLKVQVKDRTKIKITEDERQCVEPAKLQSAIDELVAKFGENARSFVRPSQTEDIVRVYAEANNQENANQLAEQVAAKVREFVV